VDRDDLSAKFWIKPVQLARYSGFAASELKRIHGLIAESQIELLEAWNGYFVSRRG
jgi:hypothetical protein